MADNRGYQNSNPSLTPSWVNLFKHVRLYLQPRGAIDRLIGHAEALASSNGNGGITCGPSLSFAPRATIFDFFATC